MARFIHSRLFLVVAVAGATVLAVWNIIDQFSRVAGR